MQLGTRLAKKHQKELRNATAQQMSIAQTDADIIEKTLDALENVKASAAREILSKPEDLKRLLTNGDKNPIACFYILHALFIILAFREINQREFLNSMSDKNIGILRELVIVAKTRIRPIPETLNNLINKRKKEQFVATPLEQIKNRAMISSARLSISVEKYWGDAIQELETWLNEINNFKREEQASKDDDSLRTWWSMEELAEKLGCKNVDAFYRGKCKLLKQRPTLAGEINSWFGQKGVKKLFNPKCFAELKTLWNETLLQPEQKAKQGRRPRKTSVAPRASVKTAARKKSKNIATAPASQIVENTQKAKAKRGRKPKEVKEEAKAPKDDKEVKTLVDVKSFETFLRALEKTWRNNSETIEKEEASYKDICSKISVTDDLEKRTDLLKQANSVNDSIKESRKKHENLSKTLHEGLLLLGKQQELEKALTQLNKKIESFLDENYQIMK